VAPRLSESRMAIGFLLLLTCARTWGEENKTTQASSGDFEINQDHQKYRVRFDPGNRLRLGTGFGWGWRDQDQQWPWELRLGLDLRSKFFFETNEDEVSWQLEHHIASGWLRPFSNDALGVPELDVSVYRGLYRRHSKSSYITLPSSPPRRLFFPLDIGVEGEVGRLAFGNKGGQEVLRLGIARAALVLDPWRSGRTGNSLEFGLGARYDLELRGTPMLQDATTTIHRVAPFTAISVRFCLQSDDGLNLLELRTDVVPAWVSSGGFDLTIETKAHFERVLLAINDQPLALTLDGSYQHHPAFEKSSALDEIKLILGLNFSFQL
jgi:hypothetical protein